MTPLEFQGGSCQDPARILPGGAKIQGTFSGRGWYAAPRGAVAASLQAAHLGGVFGTPPGRKPRPPGSVEKIGKNSVVSWEIILYR